jgi:DNA-binding winged helix-turn-helix (wHTH) protein/TolB-like protein/Tfp pilus assembly protein PilF
MNGTTAQRLNVGEWSVNPATNDISRGAERVHLEPKAVDLLVTLAQHANQVMSREELLSQVWRGVIVGDDVLTQAIIKLRKALGDTSREPAYIQTIPKRGYRLIAAVSWIDAQPPAAPEPAKQSFSRRHAYWIAGALVLAAAVLLGFWLRASNPLVLSTEAISAAQIDAAPKVVVVPFKEIPGDRQQSLLARGFTSRLITDIGRFPDVRVIVLPAQGQEAQSVGKFARGSYIVTGDVQRGADKIRLYVRLVDAASGEALWSEQYDRPYSDLLTLQDELTQRVLAKLRVKVSDAELRRRARPYTRNLQAYEYFLRAQAALLAREKTSNELARTLYSKALELDPSFARAQAGLALTYAADRRNNWIPDGQAALARAADLANNALQLDPDSPEVHFAVAYVSMERGGFSEALGDLRAAVRLNPSYADAYALMAGIQTYVGRPDETIPLIGAAMRLSPGAGYLYYLILGRAQFFLGDLDSAAPTLRQAIERNHEDVESHLYLAATLMQAGKREAARWEMEEIRSLDPTFDVRTWLKNYPLADARLRERLVKTLESVTQ